MQSASILSDMKNILLFLIFAVILSTSTAFAKKITPDFLVKKQNDVHTKVLRHEHLKFDYISTEGEYSYACKHVQSELNPYVWTLYCDRYVFSMHIVLSMYPRAGETTIEFHAWADETAMLKETHTQSTFLTVDKEKAAPKEILGFLGFEKDAMQLQIKVKL